MQNTHHCLLFLLRCGKLFKDQVMIGLPWQTFANDSKQWLFGEWLGCIVIDKIYPRTVPQFPSTFCIMGVQNSMVNRLKTCKMRNTAHLYFFVGSFGAKYTECVEEVNQFCKPHTKQRQLASRRKWIILSNRDCSSKQLINLPKQ